VLRVIIPQMATMQRANARLFNMWSMPDVANSTHSATGFPYSATGRRTERYAWIAPEFGRCAAGAWAGTVVLARRAARTGLGPGRRGHPPAVDRMSGGLAARDRMRPQTTCRNRSVAWRQVRAARADRAYPKPPGAAPPEVWSLPIGAELYYAGGCLSPIGSESWEDCQCARSYCGQWAR
jgi:hypothetical protein